MITSNALIPVPFRGATLFVVEHQEQPFTPMKPIVEGMGLNWDSQNDKFRTNTARWGVAIIAIPSNGGEHQMVCLPLRKLPGWLMSIQPSRVKGEIRETVIAYQNECDDVLWRYWNEGAAHNLRFRPEKTRKALPGGLTVEQQDAVKALTKSRVEILAHDRQAKAAITCWSSIKSKFGVGYKEVPAEHFGEVLSLLARLPLEGEVLPGPRGRYDFPLSFWRPANREGLTGWLTWAELSRRASRPLPALLARLAEDGNDIEGARIEYQAMRHLLEVQHWILEGIARDMAAYPNRGLGVAAR